MSWCKQRGAAEGRGVQGSVRGHACRWRWCALQVIAIALLAPLAAAQSLVADPEQLAPGLLSVPGEAMLLDPPSPPEEDRSPDAPLIKPQLADEAGLASWYGARFHKRRTASGELFDMKALTAAHPTLPFGSHVCVRSQVNGRSVVVRINDRGPHTGNRVIDLSQGAAEVLGMVGLGLKPVELFALDDGEKHCPGP